MTTSRFERALEGVEALSVRSAGSDAWFLDLPIRPWRQKRAEFERRELFRLLLADDPVCGFCLDDEEHRNLLAAIGVEGVISPNWTPWLFMRADMAVRSLDHLYVGEWCQFSFDRLPPEPPPVPRRFGTDPGAIRQFTRDIGGSVCVLSFPDDREWLVVFVDREDGTALS